MLCGMKQGVCGSLRGVLSAAVVVSLWFAWSLATARTAEACSCKRPQAVCDAVNRADLIFSGKVLSAGRMGRNSTVDTPYVTTFEVQESFLGKVDKTVEIVGEHCDDTFQVGKVMLVYATQSPRGIHSGCSRTRLLADAQDDLKELRVLKDQRNGKAVGTITRTAHNADPVPLAGVTVHLISTEKRRAESTTTDAQGNYQLELPLDTYALKVEVPRTLTASWVPGDVMKLRHPGACVRGDASFKRNGVITGKVMGKLKKGVPGVKVYALDANAPRQIDDGLPMAVTDKRGNYRLEGLASATYHVVVSPDGITAEQPYPITYALGERTPDTARRYDLTTKLSEHADLLLPPPHPVHLVALRVLQDGRPTDKPVQITRVPDDNHLLDTNPDGQGTFRIKALAGPVKWEVCVHEMASRVPKTSCTTVELDVKRAEKLDVTVPSAD